MKTTDLKPTTAEERARWKRRIAKDEEECGIFDDSQWDITRRLIADVERLTEERDSARRDCEIKAHYASTYAANHEQAEARAEKAAAELKRTQLLLTTEEGMHDQTKVYLEKALAANVALRDAIKEMGSWARIKGELPYEVEQRLLGTANASDHGAKVRTVLGWADDFYADYAESELSQLSTAGQNLWRAVRALRGEEGGGEDA